MMTQNPSLAGRTDAAAGPGRAAGPPALRARRREKAAQWLFLAPALIYMAAFFGYPIVKNVVMSFQNFSVSSLYTGAAPFAGLLNYRAILTSGLFGQLAWNTAVFTVVSLAGQFT